jgi:hypothetical protein
MESEMKTATAALAIVATLAAVATPAFARAHRDPASYGQVNSGYSAATNWNDIEISRPEGGM